MGEEQPAPYFWTRLDYGRQAGIYREQQEKQGKPSILIVGSGKYVTVRFSLPSRPFVIFSLAAYRQLCHLMEQAYIMCLKYRQQTPGVKIAAWEHNIWDDMAYFQGVPRQHAGELAGAMIQAAYGGGVVAPGKHLNLIVHQYAGIQQEVDSHYWGPEDARGERTLLPKYHAKSPVPTDEPWYLNFGLPDAIICF